MPVVITRTEQGKTKVVDVDISAAKIIDEMNLIDLAVEDFETGRWIRKIKPPLRGTNAALVTGRLESHGLEIIQVTEDDEPKAGRAWFRNSEGGLEHWKEKAKAKRKPKAGE